MARVKMSDPVEFNGMITTLKELAELNLLEFNVHNNLEKRDGNYRIGYFARPIGFNGLGWEISKYAYESRVNTQSTITEQPEQQPIKKTCENCKWYLVDFSVGISGECECDQWPETITDDEQINNYIESYGEKCPGHQFKKWS